MNDAELPDLDPKQRDKIVAHLHRLARHVSRPSRGFKITRRDRDDGQIDYQITAEEPDDVILIGYVSSTRHDAEFVAAVLAQAPYFDQLLRAGASPPSTMSGKCGCDGPTRIDPNCKWHGAGASPGPHPRPEVEDTKEDSEER